MLGPLGLKISGRLLVAGAEVDGGGEELEGVGGGGDVFLADESIEACVGDGFGDGGVVELLGGIEFISAGDACGVVVADVLMVLADGADDVSLHDLHVVDVVEELEVG